MTKQNRVGLTIGVELTQGGRDMYYCKERETNKMTRKEKFDVSIIGILVLASSQFVYLPVFAEGPVDISIVEEVDDGSGYKDWEDITDAMPGMTYSAIPQVKNDGSLGAYVEMCLSESATNAGGETIALPANTFEISINEHWSLSNRWVTNAVDPAAGNCYEYDSMLEVGALTEPIFTEVALNRMLGNEYQGATFNLHLEAIAVDEKPDDPVGPVNPDVPGNPDTGTTNAPGLDAALVIPYVLGIAAIVVLIIHLLRNALRK